MARRPPVGAGRVPPDFPPNRRESGLPSFPACVDVAILMGMTDQPSQPHDPRLQLGHFELTSTSANIDHRSPPALQEWAGPLLFALWSQQASPWWIGDLLNAGDMHFGEMFSQVCEGAISADQLQRYESIARRVPRENRRPGLSWSAHAAVARLPHRLQRTMLEKAEKHGWTSTVLNRKVREEIARRKRLGQPLDENGDEASLESDAAIEPYDT